jgi:hypothetical protein
MRNGICGSKAFSKFSYSTKTFEAYHYGGWGKRQLVSFRSDLQSAFVKSYCRLRGEEIPYEKIWKENC